MRKIIAITFPLIFLLINVKFGSAQSDIGQIKFNSVKEGIPKRGVYSIAEDNFGFMWFGTDGAGIFRFDGNNYKPFAYSEDDSTSINGNLVFDMCFDSKNRLWVGTSTGLNLYNSEREEFKEIQINFEEENKVFDFTIRSIYEKDENNLILGTNGNGILRHEISTGETTVIPCKGINQNLLIIHKIVDYLGNLYAATNKGLIVFDEANNIIKIAEFPTKNGIHTISESLESITVDEKNNLWIGTTKSGLSRISQQTEYFESKTYKFTKKRILSLVTMEDNRLICGTENDGLFLVEEDDNSPMKYVVNKFGQTNVNSNSIWSLYKDSHNRIWLGSYSKGISVYDKLYNKFENVKSLLNNNSLQGRAVSGMIEDEDGKIWIGIDGAGLDIYDPKTRELVCINSVDKSSYSGLESDDIVSLFMDKEGNTWIGSWGSGIFFLKKGTNKFINFTVENTKGKLASNRILSFSEDSKGRIWMGTFEAGLNYFDPKKNTFIHCNSDVFVKNDLIYNHIRVLKVDEFDNIWLGSTIGLFKIRLEDKEDGSEFFVVKSFREK